MPPLTLYSDEARNGLHPSVAAPADTGTERLRELRGRRPTGRPAGHTASAEGSGPDTGTDIKPSGEQ